MARNSAAWKTARRSAASSPSVSVNAVATAQVASPFSNGTPEARSVVSDSAANTSATRIGDIRAGYGPEAGRPVPISCCAPEP